MTAAAAAVAAHDRRFLMHGMHLLDASEHKRLAQRCTCMAIVVSYLYHPNTGVVTLVMAVVVPRGVRCRNVDEVIRCADLDC